MSTGHRPKGGRGRGERPAASHVSAIAWLTTKGNFAFEWDTYKQNTLGVATAADELNTMTRWLLAGRVQVVGLLGPDGRRKGVPDANREVGGAGDKPGAVGAPVDGVNEPGVAVQLGDLLAA